MVSEEEVEAATNLLRLRFGHFVKPPEVRAALEAAEKVREGKEPDRTRELRWRERVAELETELRSIRARHAIFVETAAALTGKDKSDADNPAVSS